MSQCSLWKTNVKFNDSMKKRAIIHVCNIGSCSNDVNLMNYNLFPSLDQPNQHTERKFPPLNCSKYLVIGESTLKKSKPKHVKLWKNVEISPDPVVSKGKEPSFDKYNLYGDLKRASLNTAEFQEDCMFPTINSSRRHLFDADVVKERQLVCKDYAEEGPLNTFKGREVYIPSVYPDYFSNTANRKHYTSTKYAQEFNVRNRRRPSCKKCKHQQTSSIHYCDVLGKRACDFCTQYVDRHFSQIYEKLNLR